MKKEQIFAVDLDHTLIKVDLLEESIFLFLKKQPWKLFLVLFYMLFDRLKLKNYVANFVQIDPETLPYNENVLSFIQQQKSEGHRVILASASSDKLVKQISEHLGLFDQYLGSKEINLKGKAKLEALRKLFPTEKISYVGDSAADLVIWRELGKAYVVGASNQILNKLKAEGIETEVVSPRRKPGFRLIQKAFRSHQWVKNILIFLPLFLSHNLNVHDWALTLLSFFAFSFTASSIYVINDLFDLEADRKHRKKKHRAFASGDLSISQGLALYAVVAIAAIILAWQVNFGFMMCLLVYFIANLGYTLKLKQVHSLDIILLASMYTIRIVAGSETTEIVVSNWLLAFSTFLFFGLAALKRFVEVSGLSQGQKAAGRGYIAEDRTVLGALGCGGSLMASLVLSLYFSSSDVLELYKRPDILWLIVPIHIFWVSSIWILASRGQIDDDPVLHTLKSKSTYVLGAFVICLVYFAA